MDAIKTIKEKTGEGKALQNSDKKLYNLHFLLCEKQTERSSVFHPYFAGRKQGFKAEYTKEIKFLFATDFYGFLKADVLPPINRHLGSSSPTTTPSM